MDQLWKLFGMVMTEGKKKKKKTKSWTTEITEKIQRQECV